MKISNRKIVVLCGGQSPEHDVSLSSGITCTRAMHLGKYAVKPVCIGRTGEWNIPTFFLTSPEERQEIEPLFEIFGSSSPRQSRKLKAYPLLKALEQLIADQIDLVFIVLHGPYGEDGTIQGLFDFLGIPYLGSGVTASALAMDKIRCQQLLENNRVRVPRYVPLFLDEAPELTVSELQRIESHLGYPCIVKPSRAGSSVGMTLARTRDQLVTALDLAREFDIEILVEQYVQGIEVTCGLLNMVDESGRRSLQALPPTEIKPLHAEFFDYDSKYIAGRSEEITPARLPENIIKKIQSVARQVHVLLGCDGLSRVDMIVKEDEPYVLELNTIPGMTPTSLLPQGAKAMGIDFSQLLDILITYALTRRAKQK
jgi:D-alanine-D-alanine ligase